MTTQSRCTKKRMTTGKVDLNCMINNYVHAYIFTLGSVLQYLRAMILLCGLLHLNLLEID